MVTRHHVESIRKPKDCSLPQGKHLYDGAVQTSIFPWMVFGVVARECSAYSRPAALLQTLQCSHQPFTFHLAAQEFEWKWLFQVLGLNFKLCCRVWHFYKEWSIWKGVTCISEYWTGEKVWETCEETVFTELKVQFQRNSGIPHLRPSHERERAFQKKTGTSEGAYENTLI